MNTKSLIATFRRKKLVHMIAFVFICSVLLSTTGPCFATEVWSDNFDDYNCDGWTVSGCSATDGTLRSTSTAGTAYCASSVTVGTWSFDLEIQEYGSGPSETFEFGAVTPTVFFMSTHPDETPWYFYSVYATQVTTQTAIKPVMQIRKNSPNGGGAFNTWVKLASHDLEDGDFGWKHIDVARTSGGQITVWLNGTLILQAVDTELDTSEYFVFKANEEMAIDNIVLDDVPKAAGIPLEFVAAGVGVTVVVIVTVIWLKKRNA